MLTCLISISYHKGLLAMKRCTVSGNTLKIRPVMVSEGSQIHCFCLLREPPHPSPEGGGGQTDCPCSVFSFCSFWRLVRLRAQTCSAPFEGNLKSRAFLVGLTQEGVDQAFVWVVLMKKAEGGVKKRRRNHRRVRADGVREARDVVVATVKRLHATWNVSIKHHLNTKSLGSIRP